MRKIITIFLLAIAVMASAEEHLKFKGIPIDGELVQFCRELEKQDFRLAQLYTNAAIYEGLFTNRLAYITVETTPRTNIVNTVVVCYQNLSKWKEMETSYFELKEKLIKKYGEPAKVEELGSGPSSDMMIKKHIEDGKVKRRTVIETELGEIILCINNVDLFDVYESPYLYVAYVDKANQAKSEKEADDDL